MTGDGKVPVTRAAGDIDPKVSRGGVAAVTVGAIVTALAAQYAPDLALADWQITAIAVGIVAVAQSAVAYATQSLRRRTSDEKRMVRDGGQGLVGLVVGVLLVLILVFVLLRLL